MYMTETVDRFVMIAQSEVGVARLGHKSAGQALSILEGYCLALIHVVDISEVTMACSYVKSLCRTVLTDHRKDVRAEALAELKQDRLAEKLLERFSDGNRL